jgi:hypothetical protein
MIPWFMRGFRYTIGNSGQTPIPLSVSLLRKLKRLMGLVGPYASQVHARPSARLAQRIATGTVAQLRQDLRTQVLVAHVS